MNYNKETSKTLTELISNRKWGKFLAALPNDTPCGYRVSKADAQILRIRAAQIAKQCDRIFSIRYNDESQVLIITATRKKDDEEN